MSLEIFLTLYLWAIVIIINLINGCIEDDWHKKVLAKFVKFVERRRKKRKRKDI